MVADLVLGKFLDAKILLYIYAWQKPLYEFTRNVRAKEAVSSAYLV